MITRARQVVPEMLEAELLRLYKLDPDWVEVRTLEERQDGRELYHARPKYPTPLTRSIRVGPDIFSVWALSAWLGGGPKIFRPTVEQCAAMEQVEIRLTLGEYRQPYDAILVDLPDGAYAPFKAVVCHSRPLMASYVLISDEEDGGIVTTIRVDGRPMEESLTRFDPDCADVTKTASRALRVAVNACLCLVNFGCRHKLMFEKQTLLDRELARENSDRGRAAAVRAKTATRLVEFNHEVVLHETRGAGGPGTGPGEEKSFHWRSGHWKMQPHGPQSSLRKRIFVKPVMVRADLLVGDVSDHTTTYRSKA